jgi:hypothetical protein
MGSSIVSSVNAIEPALETIGILLGFFQAVAV